MSDVQQKATQARQLAEYEPFQAIVEDIRQGALDLFLNGNSAITEIARAHEAIRAIDMFMAAIQSRLDAEKVAQKKGQDRGSD